MDKQTDARKNRLLAALPEDALERWLPHLEPVDMPLGHVLYEPGSTLSHVYFSTSAIVSLLYVMKNGASAEIAVVGNEARPGHNHLHFRELRTPRHLRISLKSRQCLLLYHPRPRDHRSMHQTIN